MSKPLVYILEAQSLTALTTARAISNKYSPVALYLEGTEHNISLQSSVWNEKIAICGLVDRAVPQLISLVSKHKLREDCKPVLLTATDDGVLFLSKNRDLLSQYFIVPLPDKSVVELLMDKSVFYKWAELHQQPIIRTRLCESDGIILETLKSFPLPFIIKPKVRDAVWNNRYPVDKILFVESEETREDFIKNCKSMFSDIDGVIIQKYIPGADDQIFFVLFAYDLDGKLITQFAGQKLGQWPPRGGSTMVCVPYTSPEVLRVTSQIFSLIPMIGLASMEYKKCAETGSYYIIEPTVGRCDHQSLIAELSGVPLVTLFLDSLHAGSRSNVLSNENKYRVWMDEVAFLRLAKMDLRAAINLIHKIGLLNLWRVRPLLFRISDMAPWLKAMKLLLRRGKRKLP